MISKKPVLKQCSTYLADSNTTLADISESLAPRVDDKLQSTQDNAQCFYPNPNNDTYLQLDPKPIYEAPHRLA